MRTRKLKADPKAPIQSAKPPNPVSQSLNDIFKQMGQAERETLERILTQLLKIDEDLSAKTDLEQPLEITRLSVMAKWAKDEGATDANTILEFLIKDYKTNRVSYKRKSREEVVRAIASRMANDDKSLAEKLSEVST